MRVFGSRTVYYCSRECQTMDWKQHKATCAIVAKVTAKQLAKKPQEKLANRVDAQKQEKFEEKRERADAPPEEPAEPVISCLRCAAECVRDQVHTCPECEKVSYCSEACREVHASVHVHHCTAVLRREMQLRNEEARQLQEGLDAKDAPRRMAEAAAAAEALAKRIAAVQAEEAAAAAAEREAASRRQEAIAAERTLRPDHLGARESLPGPSHTQPKERPARPAPSLSEQVEHQQWVEEKPLRSAAFEAKQAAEHADAVARKAKAKLDAERQLAAEIDKELQARLHVVPPKPVLSTVAAAAAPSSSVDGAGPDVGASTSMADGPVEFSPFLVTGNHNA